MILALASPLGNTGRPTFLGLAIADPQIAKLANDKGSDGCSWSQCRVDMQHGHGIDSFPGVMQPCVGLVSLWMAFNTKHFHSPVPHFLW